MNSLKLPIILDGATATMLQGMPQGVCPEKWILENPQKIIDIQKAYVEAGSDIVYAPTFGANRVKLGKFGLEMQVDEMNTELVALSRTAVEGKAYVAGDMSPLGMFLDPIGEGSMEQFIDIYKQQAVALEKSGVDLFVIETLMTIAEARSAVIAIREVSSKPIFTTFTVDENGKTIMGTDILTALTIMQNMGVAAFGLNCSAGPDKMLESIKKIYPYSKVPIIIKPNAGVPHVENGETLFDLCPNDFIRHTKEFLSYGVGIFGGCCGTTPQYMKSLKSEVEKHKNEFRHGDYSENREEIIAATEKNYFFIDTTVDMSEIIDATASLAEDLLDVEDDTSQVLRLRINHEEAFEYFKEVQYMINMPLCIVSDNSNIFEKSVREFNGRAIYDASSKLDNKIIEACVNKYGLIKL